MEYIPGENMQKLINFLDESDTGKLIATPDFIKRIFIDFLEVFECLNTINYQLFDLKPDNMMGSKGRFVFIDLSFISLSYDYESKDSVLDLMDDNIGLFGLAGLVFSFIFGNKAVGSIALQEKKKGNNKYIRDLLKTTGYIYPENIVKGLEMCVYYYDKFLAKDVRSMIESE